MNESLVSVIIPTYGRPDFLERAINSVLGQSYFNVEVVIVDDNPAGSEGRVLTEKLMLKFADLKRVIYIKHEKNKRVAAARNTGIRAAHGRYISFLDDDDEYTERKLEEQVKFLEANLEFNGCYCRFQSFSKGKLTRKSSYSKQGDLSLDVYEFKCTGNASCYMFRSKVLVGLNGFTENLPRHEDFEMLVRFFETNLMGFVDYYGVRRHTDSRINMPSIQEYVEIKKEFFISVEGNLTKLPKSVSRKIKKIHQADVFFYAIRKRGFLNSLVFFPGPVSALSYLYIKLPNIVEILKRKIK